MKKIRVLSAFILLIFTFSILTVSAAAYDTYVSFSNRTIASGEQSAVTSYTDLDSGKYTVVISKNTNSCELIAVLCSGDGTISTEGTIYGTGNVTVKVSTDDSYRLNLRNDDFDDTTVSGYFRSQS